jgi:SAM-dependent methyltransferase
MAFEQNHQFYAQSISKYGNSAKGVHWNSRSTQYARFAVISGFIEDIKNSSIIDAGCGMGHYINYLKQYDLMPKSYLGIDCEEQMIHFAKQQHPDENFEILNILEDQLPFADYYICSGALNILSVAQMYKFINRCYEQSNKGFVFNFLSNMSYNNASVDDVIGYCQSLCNTIKTKNDYLHNDFTIVMVK